MKEFFKENGHFSMIRLLSFIVILLVTAVCTVIVILSLIVKPETINGIYFPADTTVIRELIYLTGTLLMFAFGGKAVQKYAEREISITEPGEDNGLKNQSEQKNE
jgi:hypothetical protein